MQPTLRTIGKFVAVAAAQGIIGWLATGVITAASQPGWVRTVVIGAVWIALFVVAYLLLIRWLPALPQAPEPPPVEQRKNFKNETVRISDLVSSESGPAILDSFVFEDCTLVGPTLLHMLPGPPDNLIVGGGFSDPIDSSVVTVSTSNKLVIGLVGIRGVRMIRCQFKGVGFAAGEQRAADLKTALLRSMVEGKRTELKHGEPLSPDPADDDEARFT